MSRRQKRREPRIVVCKNCREVFFTRDSGVYCKKAECQAAALKAPVPLEKVFSATNVYSLEVVNDPLEPGGFRAGQRFNLEEIEAMVKYWSFTPGTILRDLNGRLYVA